MPQLTRNEIEGVASLSRIKLSEPEIDKLTIQINETLDSVQELISLDTDGVEPTVQITSAVNVFRKDEITPSLSVDDATANGPQVAENCFVVPRVVDT
ncbi:MAG: Asp-tRNA(Asn)/Glu-tRNA(Gln) amidotransferase subunit GatC [Armatimonadota bacterium]